MRQDETIILVSGALSTRGKLAAQAQRWRAQPYNGPFLSPNDITYQS